MTTTVRTIFSINATDRSHDFLVIRRGPAGISIEAQSREDEWESATAGPFTPEQLRAALDEVAPAGSYTRTDEGAHIGPDGEVDWRGLYLSENRRAEKAERERDEARRHECSDLDAHWRLDETLASLKEANATVASLRAEQPRPLTADDITAEMIQRAQREEERQCGDWAAPTAMRHILTAALTEPTRPKGAEKVEAVLHQYWSGDINGDDLADRIAEEMNR